MRRGTTFRNAFVSWPGFARGCGSSTRARAFLMIESERNLPSGLRTNLGARRSARPQEPCCLHAEDNPAATQRFVRGVFQILERLPRFRESGRIVPEFNDAQIREVLRNPVESCTGSSPKNKSLKLPESGMQPEAFWNCSWPTYGWSRLALNTRGSSLPVICLIEFNSP